MQLNNRTAEKREEDIDVLSKLSMKELRKRQGLVREQIAVAFKKKDEAALENLQAMDDDLMNAVMKKNWPKDYARMT